MSLTLGNGDLAYTEAIEFYDVDIESSNIVIIEAPSMEIFNMGDSMPHLENKVSHSNKALVVSRANLEP